jgi:hypothetical protein
MALCGFPTGLLVIKSTIPVNADQWYDSLKASKVFFFAKSA